MRRRLLLVAIVAALSVAVDGAALAAANTSTTFKMKDLGNSVEYSGEISSPQARCLKNRVVKIFHKGVLIAQTTSNEDGKWKTVGPEPPKGDQVTAKVKPKKKQGKKICKGTSRTKTY